MSTNQSPEKVDAVLSIFGACMVIYIATILVAADLRMNMYIWWAYMGLGVFLALGVIVGLVLSFRASRRSES